jgi:Ca-activated chloride channel family protein
MNPCNVKPFLTAYVLGDLEPKKAQAIQTHLESCPACREQVEALQKTLSLVKMAFPAEHPQTEKAPVLDPERRMKLLSIKPVVKQNRFLLFIEKAYRPIRAIAATLLCVFGILAIISAAMPAGASRKKAFLVSLADEESYALPKGSGNPVVRFSDSDALAAPAPAAESAPATPADVSFDNAAPEKAERNYAVAGKKSKRRATEEVSSRATALDAGSDATTLSYGGAKSETTPVPQASHGRIGGEASGAEKLRSKSEVKRDRYDDGLEAATSVNAVPPPASAPEPMSPQPQTFDAVAMTKSPVILKNVYGSSRGGSAMKARLSLKEEKPAEAVAEAIRPSGEVAAADAPLSLGPDSKLAAQPASGAAGGAFYYREVAKGEKDSRMEPLRIDLPKPTFTGTPKDIKSDNLEEPGARRGQILYGSAPDTRRTPPPQKKAERLEEELIKKWQDQIKSRKLIEASEIEVNGTTVVSAGTLGAGRVTADQFEVADQKRLEKARHEEESLSRQMDDVSELKKKEVHRLIADQRKNESADELRDEGRVVNGPKGSVRAGIAGNPADGNKPGWLNDKENKQVMFKGGAAALDLPRKPSRPVEPLPFNPFVMTAAEQFSTFAMDVDTASYTLTRQALRSGKLPDPERVRLEEIVNAFDYGDKASDKATFRIYQDGAQSQFGAGYNLLRIGVKGRRLGREEQRPAMLTMVLDVSGSMSQPDRIGFARLSLSSLLDQMGADDRIQIIAYSDQAQFVVEPTPAKEKKRIMAAFDRLQCNGSTNLEEGLKRAYEQAVQAFIPGAENRVILISDGVANLGADSAQEILDKVAVNRKQGITCSVFGVGAGTYNDKMLEDLANKGDGVYRFLDSAEAVKTAFVDDLAATLNTIAKDAKIQVEWNPKTVRRYRQMGYENRKLKKEQFRDDTVDAGEVGSGQSVTALYELELMPNVTAESNIGTVRVRYQRTDNGKVEEISAPLLASTVLKPAHKATPSFKVAASAAEFAELLRNSPNAQGGSFESVADYLRPAALEMTLDTRVKELLELVTTANALSK